MQQDKLTKLKELLKLVNEGLSREEYLASLKTFTEHIKSLEKKVIERADTKLAQHGHDIDKLAQDFKELIEKAKKEKDSTFGSIKARVAQMVENFWVKSSVDKRVAETVSKLEKRISNIKDGEDGHTPTREELEEIIRPLITQKKVTPEEVRDKLESLTGEERLDMDAIEGLKEALDKAASTNKVSGMFGSRRVYQPYVDDFSGDTDGTTKTFYLSREPLKANAVTVFGTDFPTILRPSIDFTVSGKTLTLQSGVSAPSSGATLICTFFA